MLADVVGLGRVDRPSLATMACASLEERPSVAAYAMMPLQEGSVWELPPPSVCTVFVANAPFAASAVHSAGADGC